MLLILLLTFAQIEEQPATPIATTAILSQFEEDELLGLIESALPEPDYSEYHKEYCPYLYSSDPIPPIKPVYPTPQSWPQYPSPVTIVGGLTVLGTLAVLLALFSFRVATPRVKIVSLLKTEVADGQTTHPQQAADVASEDPVASKEA